MSDKTNQYTLKNGLVYCIYSNQFSNISIELLIIISFQICIVALSIHFHQLINHIMKNYEIRSAPRSDHILYIHVISLLKVIK